MKFPFWLGWPIFRGELLVLGSVSPSHIRIFLIDSYIILELTYPHPRHVWFEDMPRDFWLIEGFTVYARKVMDIVTKKIKQIGGLC